MPTRGESRWDGNDHYYDYTPQTVRCVPNRDAFVVAEAFIYDANKVERIAITVFVSGQELKMDNMPREEVIRRGAAVRTQAIADHSSRLPAKHRAVLYDLAGREIEVEEPR